MAIFGGDALSGDAMTIIASVNSCGRTGVSAGENLDVGVNLQVTGDISVVGNIWIESITYLFLGDIGTRIDFLEQMWRASLWQKSSGWGHTTRSTHWMLFLENINNLQHLKLA
ncbi:unnamed protein product [Absidia cylindrospora]